MKRRDLDQMWTKFQFEQDDSGDHVVALLRHGGKIIVKTKRSHGSGDVISSVQRHIQKQMKLSRDQFRDAVACPLTREGYLEILRGQGAL